MARPRSIDLAELEQLRAGGASVADVAVRFGVTERSVKRALAALRLAAAGETLPADAHHHQADGEHVGRVRVLLDGLMVDGKVYRAGELVEDPHPRLVVLAGGELLLGRRVAEFVEAEGAEKSRGA